MINVIEERKQLKREFRSKKYLESKLEELDNKLEEMRVILEGVSSPAIKEVIYENARNPYHDRKLELIMKEEKLIKERDYYKRRLAVLDEVMLVCNDEVKEMINDRLIEQINELVLEKKYSVSDISTIDKRINRELQRIIKMEIISMF